MDSRACVRNREQLLFLGLKDTLFLLHNMQPPVVVAVVWQNGTKSLKENLYLIMKQLISVLLLSIGCVRSSVLIEENFVESENTILQNANAYSKLDLLGSLYKPDDLYWLERNQPLS